MATLAEANRAPGHRAVGPTKAGRISALAKDTIAPPELARPGFGTPVTQRASDLRMDDEERPLVAWAQSITPI